MASAGRAKWLIGTSALLVMGGLFGASPALAQGKKAPVDPTKIVLHGAGATFPAPLYKKWITEYTKVDPKVMIDYKDIGSGEGVKRFLEHTVDFGASDYALSDDQLAKLKSGVILLPMAAGMVVLAYNLPGVNGPLKLSRAVYLDILAGKIQKWNDPRIQSVNPTLKLPNKTIAIVARLDSSGTTFALANHLAAMGPKWREYGGAVGNVVDWPGKAMLAKGNEGVAGVLKQAEGSIGYVEYGFARRLKLPMAHLENKAGRYIEPTAAAGKATLAANLESIPENLRIFLPDPIGEDSYPIVSLTWLLLHGRYGEAEKAAALKRFIGWSLADGQSYGDALGYVPLPGDLIERAKTAAGTVQ